MQKELNGLSMECRITAAVEGGEPVELFDGQLSQAVDPADLAALVRSALRREGWIR